jgi:hypothetical protein
MAELTIGEITFQFGEVSHGGKGRGISIHRNGVSGDQHVYMFTPNPHNDPSYNKNVQKWYVAAATQIAQAVVTTGWPEDGNVVTVNGIDYTLIPRD